MARSPWLAVLASALLTVLAASACGANGEVGGDGKTGNELCAPLTGKACNLTDQTCTLRPRTPDFLYEAICSETRAFVLDEICTPHTDSSDCMPGLACVPLSTTDSAPRCAKICVADSGCESGEQCFVPGVAVAANATSVGTCRSTCVIGANTCAGSDHCTPRQLLHSPTGEPEEIGTCNPIGAGPGNTGDSCTTLEDCADGLGCLGVTTLVCRPLCSASQKCAAGSSCVASSTSPDATGKWYGVCAPDCASATDCTAPFTCQSIGAAPDPTKGASVCIH